jgi:hypothetical protein
MRKQTTLHHRTTRRHQLRPLRLRFHALRNHVQTQSLRYPDHGPQQTSRAFIAVDSLHKRLVQPDQPVHPRRRGIARGSPRDVRLEA